MGRVVVVVVVQGTSFSQAAGRAFKHESSYWKTSLLPQQFSYHRNLTQHAGLGHWFPGIATAWGYATPGADLGGGPRKPLLWELQA
ncbi:hypothetical protein SKAU_G00305380 [Synaphobranchus kaupii]|uniref:Uncharacterized protein n=1 Tax=Synaphobranchus kaupii TaxID=118154 RepID=A0A9Q1IIL1_SYNKA|nr:hypothetical protein SKAU_G00305380 [Synaphobranchus kaupii]